ncbi:MAG: ABC transporter ATP-binding protein [Candidatus Omnitrophota bacterium]|nr:ABC transporter ATP-binding protein [Candidatus Omnitrophota bacterium]
MRDESIAVSVQNLEKKFGAFTAVNRINFDVNKGEIFGFLGPNGAGKSTTIRMLCGIITPTSGTGTVGGFDIMKEQEKIKQNIGYMSQKFSLYDDLTVEENINFYGGIYKLSKHDRDERKEKIIKLAGIEAFRSSPTKTLSGGWKQRLALGCSLIHKPRIIFLDEPTSGVDPITRANFWGIIKDLAKEGVTVFVTTHYMDEAENCDRMTLIYKGTIIAMGTPEEMKTKFMKSEIIQIRVDTPEMWTGRLSTVEGVEEAALFGSAIHVVSPEAKKTMPLITELFEREGLKNYKIAKIKASLEDVFVSLIEDYDKEHNA